MRGRASYAVFFLPYILEDINHFGGGTGNSRNVSQYGRNAPRKVVFFINALNHIAMKKNNDKAFSGPYMIGPNGLEELHPAPALAVGTKIVAFGYAGIIQNFAICDDARNIVEIAPEDDFYLDSYFSPLNKLDEYARPISKKFGIGFYYDLDAPKYTPEEIAAGLARARRIEQLKKERAEAHAEAERRAMEEARAKYPYMKENARGAEVAANLRKELKNTFPRVAFSVRYKSFSGGDEISVKYNDGPRVEDVMRIAGKYQDHSADDSGDYWDYTPDAFNKIFGGVSFVFVERDFNPETLSKAAEYVARVCPELVGEIHRDKFREICHPQGEDAERIAEAIASAYWISPASLARWVAGLVDYTPAPVEATKETPAQGDGLQVVEYSAKCFAVIGPTKEIKETLKKLGGRFNARLTCGAGWVFPTAKREEVYKSLNL